MLKLSNHMASCSEQCDLNRDQTVNGWSQQEGQVARNSILPSFCAYSAERKFNNFELSLDLMTSSEHTMNPFSTIGEASWRKKV